MKNKLLLKAEIRELRRERYNLFYMDLWSAFQYLFHWGTSIDKTKILMELVCAFIMAMLLKKSKYEVYAVGFPCKKGRLEGVKNIEELAPSKLSKFITERLEFDVTVLYNENGENKYIKIQLVRFVHQQSVDTEAFFTFLTEKKLKKYSEDESLYLLIYIEQKLRFEYNKLNEMLHKTKVPFNNIVAIGHLGTSNCLRFVGIKIYPNVDGPIEMDFTKPPPG